jgi:hypothetical protein
MEGMDSGSRGADVGDEAGGVPVDVGAELVQATDE